MKLKPGMLAEPSLVGRKTELKELESILESIVEGKGTTIFISGEAGTGKTRLVNEFLISAKQKREITTLTGWCLCQADVPYFPFIEAFNSYFSTLSNNSQAEELKLKDLLRGPTKMGSSLPQALKDQTFATVNKTLLNISAKKPTILFIDDVHWADSASLALIHYISRTIASERILVLATYRIEDLNPDSEGRPHPLVEALRLMGRENLYKDIRLQSLSRTDVASLAENMVGGRVQKGLTEKLVSESQGNPLFIVESLRMLSEKGNLIHENNQWRLATEDLGIPAKIKDIILRRVGVLNSDQKKLLEIASVIGSKFDPQLLGVIMGKKNIEVLETLNYIAHSSSLILNEANIYRFDHVKSRETLYEQIPLLLRRAYHDSIAQNLEDCSKKNNLSVSTLAYHYAQTDNKKKAVKYSLAAGQEALALFCGAEAIKYFKFVLNTTKDDAEYTDERVIALEGLGDGFYARARCREAVEVFEQLSSSAKSDLVRLRASRKAMYASLMQGDVSRSREISDKTVENPELDLLENARVHLLKGMVKSYGRNSKEALPIIDESLRVFEKEYSLPDVADALAEMGFAAIQSGQEEKGLAALLRSCALSEYMRNLNRHHYAHTVLDVAFLYCGLPKEAQKSNAESFKIAEKVSDPISRAWEENFGYFAKANIIEATAPIDMFSGLSLDSMQEFGRGAKIKFFLGRLLSGALRKFRIRLKAAVVESLKGVECAEETDSYWAKSVNYATLTRLYAELAEKEQAEKYYNKTTKLFEETNVSEMAAANVSFLFSKAVFFSSKRQWKEANQFYEECLEDLGETQTPLGLKAGIRQSYCWTLLQQGRFIDAKMQLEEAKKALANLEKRFEHSNIQGYIIAPMRIQAGREFDLRLDLVNVAKKPAALIKVESLVPSDIKITAKQPCFSVQNGSIVLEEKRIEPFRDETFTLTMQATKAGTFNLNPQIVYVDDLGNTKTCKPKPLNLTVQPAKAAFEVVPNRITTGSGGLDRLLFGGIPRKYAVILATSPCDEKDLLVDQFLTAGIEAGETTFQLTAEATKTKAFPEEYPSTFYLFLCNPQADSIIKNLPNVYKLKGIENLTDIDIALTKAFRSIEPSSVASMRICIELISDVLLQHHAITTRKWLSALLPILKSKGFTILAIIDPYMHHAEEIQAVLSLFDGEISIYDRETPKGAVRFLKIKRMNSQKYLKDEIQLTEE